jgi:hypothetical protein
LHILHDVHPIQILTYVLKGFELSDDDELPDEEDPGQSAYADNECPDIAMLELVQPPVPVQPKVSRDFAWIRINIWNRPKIRQLLVHSLSGGGCHNLGYHAMRHNYAWQCWRVWEIRGTEYSARQVSLVPSRIPQWRLFIKEYATSPNRQTRY